MKLHVDARSTSLLYAVPAYAVPAEVRMEVKAKRMKKRRKKIGISVLLSATPLVAIVFVPIASAQGNPVNSGDLASHYQNTTGAPYSSSASWNTQIGTVNANAEFHHPILSDRNA